VTAPLAAPTTDRMLPKKDLAHSEVHKDAQFINTITNSTQEVTVDTVDVVLLVEDAADGVAVTIGIPRLG
jgi:hypothetical protein